MQQSHLLAHGLEKVRALLGGDDCTFEREELCALRDFVAPQLDRPGLSERERHSYEQIAEIVRNHGAPYGISGPPPPDDARRETGLRVTLDKFTEKRFTEVTKDDLDTLRKVHHRLAHLPEKKPAHQQLMEMMGACLADYRAFLDEHAAAAELPMGTAEAQQPVITAVPLEGRERTSADLFAEAPRQQVTELDTHPVDLRVRVCELDGDHTIQGDIPEGCLLIVKQGGVQIHGCSHGNVSADGGIVVHGSAGEGWLVSAQGDIAVDRVLPGAHLMARRGSVQCAGMEGPELIVCGGSLRVSEGVRGGVLAARDMEFGGPVVDVTLHCAGPVAAKELAGRNATATVILQRYISLHHFGFPNEPETADTLRELNACDFKAGAQQAMAEALQRDRMHCMRALLFSLGAHSKAAFGLIDLRDAQIRHALLGAVLGVGQELHNGVLEALEFDADSANRNIGAQVDACTSLLDDFEQKRIASLPATLMRDAGNDVVTAIRHVKSAAKKMCEAGRKESSLIELLDALADRLNGFETAANDAAEEVAAYVEEFPRELFAHLEDNLDALRARVAEALAQEQGARGQAREVQELKQRIEKLEHALSHSAAQCQADDATRDALRRRLAEAGAVIFGDTWPGKASVRAGTFGKGVIVGLSPLRRDGADRPVGPFVSVPESRETETCYERSGHSVRPVETGAES
ncbi:MAG: hypothetical protein ACLFTT_01405 [Candidatus Hydrogenedentota bacterium]